MTDCIRRKPEHVVIVLSDSHYVICGSNYSTKYEILCFNNLGIRYHHGQIGKVRL